MPKIKYREQLGLSKKNIHKLNLINDIIEEYQEQGYRLTLRQLYYQLVSRDIIPNKVTEYGKLSTLLVKGRMGGEVDWEAIEDRLRIPNLPYWVHGIKDAINDTIRTYRLNRMKGQDVYIELWAEKDALSSILKKVTYQYHIRLMINRGYSSCTAMYDAFNRIQSYGWGKEIIILYLGDHDPSGLDMIRDISDRLVEFGTHPVIEHVALTQEQIEEYNPPPNPTKVADPRAKWYISKFGDTSWEVDALEPQVLISMLESRIKTLIDIPKYEAIVKQEKEDKFKLKELIGGLE